MVDEAVEAGGHPGANEVRRVGVVVAVRIVGGARAGVARAGAGATDVRPLGRLVLGEVLVVAVEDLDRIVRNDASQPVQHRAVLGWREQRVGEGRGVEDRNPIARVGGDVLEEEVLVIGRALAQEFGQEGLERRRAGGVGLGRIGALEAGEASSILGGKVVWLVPGGMPVLPLA